MSFVEVSFWVCNVCGCRGPEFEGTAEAFLPNDWWTGELKCMTAQAHGGVRTEQVAICPDCVGGSDLNLAPSAADSCTVCGGDGDRCRRAWKSQRKCCADCSHRPKLGVADAER
ncbi:hypothetical protein SEA_GODPHATHER_68 [Mycobacterium phage GodPhather]|uniref:Uncharacterized protein n=1 Tax=Mycobacterium phage Jeon TaxID=2108123 RepID=A0A2P1JRJ8_9CAUD|nr:hypothetical protein PQB70_gp66 [Mycobacterium phage Jeon]AVO21769.1 hypothetical protein SEA_JEON_66 [Mycobacterium phage Jeon]QBP32641.1 hypothetical protein SEA_GODPHATHER_68 [Mycobacterium phage GodPhather]